MLCDSMWLQGGLCSIQCLIWWLKTIKIKTYPKAKKKTMQNVVKMSGVMKNNKNSKNKRDKRNKRNKIPNFKRGVATWLGNVTDN